jgi:hypothetical protein
MIMSRKYLLLLFISCSIHAIAQTDYYYYQGNKISLTLNENKVCVSIPKDCDKTCESIRTNVKVLTTIIDETFDIIVITRSDFEKLTTLDFWEEGAKSVILTSCYFTENNEEICTTPYIDVRLKKEEDFDLLTTYAEKYGLRIVKQDSLMPLWYILAITQNSEKSPLEYANELFESGDFAASVPEWGELGDPFNTVRSITTTKTNSSYGIYNLQGWRLESTPIKRIYIQNGKKRISH